MQLTLEQKNILQSTGDIKINAVAGSGKTSTIIEYARSRPSSSKILYLAFNRSVKIEAENKFAEIKLFNVKVETAHSLAYKHIVFKHNYKVRNESYKTFEIVDILGINSSSEKHFEYILANHINKFITYFCNSSSLKVQEINYLDVVNDKNAKIFVKSHYKIIEKQTRVFLSKMDKGEIEVTHDFYLKKFQLSNPNLNYDYILFDEGQDASPAMLDIFLKQAATKVIVGDMHQQIYGWRHAVNSLEKVNYPIYLLSSSFRFSEDIAKLASEILELKVHIREHKSVEISGVGKNEKVSTKAVLARTNLGLLLKAIEYVTEEKKIKNIYFEGNINSYTYGSDGASLYDVLHLYNGNNFMIKDKLIKSMKSIAELEDYIKKTDDVQLSMMIEIVEKYGNSISGIIKTLKDKHVSDEDKNKAEIIFSTVHRCKGMEYDTVQLANDFITEEKLIKLTKDKNDEDMDINKLIEEINILYVAITRTKNILYIPETLIPVDYPKSKKIIIEKIDNEKELIIPSFQQKDNWEKRLPVKYKIIKKRDRFELKESHEKVYSVAEVRKKHEKAYRPWSQEMDDKLTELYCEEKSIKEIMSFFGRTRGAIVSRIKKLELKEKYI